MNRRRLLALGGSFLLLPSRAQAWRSGVSAASTIATLKASIRSPVYPGPLAPNPPTVIGLADGANTTIANPQFVQIPDKRIFISSASDIVFSYSGTLSDGISRNFYYATAALPGSAVNYWCVEFITNAARIELLGSQNVAFNLFINDLPVQAAFFNTTNNPVRHLSQIDFDGVTTPRKIRLEGNLGANGFAGFYIAATDTLSQPLSSPPAFAFVGDSYLQKGGGYSFVSDIAAQTAWYLGGKCVMVDAIGGTGYFQNNGAVSPTTNNFAQRLGIWNTGNEKSLVVFALGGINDLATLTQAQVTAFLTSLRARYPNALIICSGLWQPDQFYTRSSPANKLETVAVSVLAAVQALSGPWGYISNLDDSWLNSSGKSKATTSIPWQTGDGCAIAFTGALIGATSATLVDAWALPTGSYTIVFSDASIRSVTLTNGSPAVTWAGAVTATSVAGAYTAVAGNSILYVSDDGTHPTVPDGVNFLASTLAGRAYDLIQAM